MKTTALTFTMATLLASSAAAEGDWIVGLIVQGDSQIYEGGTDDAILLPYLAYETDRLHIGLDGISYQALDYGDLAVDVTLNARFGPDFPDTTLFEGLDRDTAFELGFDAQYNFGAAYVGLALAGDISGAHDGYEGQASLGYAFETGALALDVSAGVILRDANLNAYLYGVSAAEATATRAAFDLGDTTNGFASVSAAFALSDQAYLIAEVSYEDLGDARNSPLVSKSESTEISIGIGFQF